MRRWLIAARTRLACASSADRPAVVSVIEVTGLPSRNDLLISISPAVASRRA
jgi:hypothetical protein